MATTFKNVKNRATTTLNDSGGISDSDVEVIVTTVGVFPSTEFWATMEDEIVLVTNIVSSTLTITRAQQGTSPAAHADGTTIALFVTAQTIDDITGAIGSLETGLATGGTDNAILRADGTGGATLQNSAVTIEDDGRISGLTDPTGDTDAVTKLYADLLVGFTFDYFFGNTSDAIGGIYYVMTDNDLGGGESDLTTVIGSTGSDKPLVNWITPSGEPGVVQLEAGIYEIHVHAEKTAGGSTVDSLYWELYKYATDTTETLLGTSETSQGVTSKTEYDIHMPITSPITLGTTDRLLVKMYANLSGGAGATVVLSQEGTTASHFEFQTESSILSSIFVRQDGTKALTANWNAGAFDITASTFIGALTGQADTVATIAGLAPDTATTQATQAAITSAANLATVGTLTSGNATAIVDAASLTAAGKIEIATVTETNTGTDATRAVSPDGLDGWTGSAQVVTVGTLSAGNATGIVSAASLTAAGKVELATGTETNTGTDATRAVTPDGLDDWTGSAQVTTLGTIASGIWSSAITGANITDVLTLDENASIALDPVGSADGKYTGITEAVTGGATIAFGEFVYRKFSDAEWYLTDANAVGTAGNIEIAVAVTSSTDGNPLTIMRLGNIRADAKFPTLVEGPVYLSETAGAITQTAPTTTDAVVRVIGFARTANEMSVQISPSHITVI